MPSRSVVEDVAITSNYASYEGAVTMAGPDSAADDAAMSKTSDEDAVIMTGG